MNLKRNRYLWRTTIALAILAIIAGGFPLLTPNFYGLETPNWQAQSEGQDMINLLLVIPLLVTTAALSNTGNRLALAAWGGTMLYMAYTYVLYCFDMHFNAMFLVYCACMGLSFYGFAFFVITKIRNMQPGLFTSTKLVRFVSAYFRVIVFLFCLLWLAEIIPALLENKTPESVSQAGLLTNGVHVLDLCIILPGVFYTGILLQKKSRYGLFFAPVFLVFFALMAVTIAVLSLLMPSGNSGTAGIAGVMLIFAVASIVLFLKFPAE